MSPPAAGPVAVESVALPEPDATERPGMHRRVRVGVAIVLGYAVVAVFAPLLARYDPLAQDVLTSLARPSWAHPLGTDELGRDVLSRVIYAGRVDLLVGMLGALLPAVVGTFLGAVAAYHGGWRDTVIMRLADVVQAFPTYILIIALVFALGQGITSILVAFTIIAWVAYARLIRTEVLRVRGLDYVDAACARGGSCGATSSPTPPGRRWSTCPPTSSSPPWAWPRCRSSGWASKPPHPNGAP
jgi:peptide/nickel transport system permease protein